MKKLIYSLTIAVMGLASSCTSFDEPGAENYGEGPSVDVSVTAGVESDSAFTVTITPAEGSLYYAYIIDANDEAEELDSAVLYKGGYGNTVVKVSDQPTTTVTIDDADPNTTYQVYAVAGSEKGIIGHITVKSITTTDRLTPKPTGVATDADESAVTLTFSEAVTRGEGAVTAKYYKEWDIMEPVDVAEEDITVEADGTDVTFSAANVPAGAYLCFSYEAGAFIDGKGNSCAALNSGLNMSTGDFSGAWVRVTSVPFEVKDDYVTAPADGALIAKVEDFEGKVKFPFDIYRNDEYVESGDLTVTYTGDKRTVTYKLDADDWSVADSIITFVLPASPAGGDIITVSIVEGAVADVYGNLNQAFTSETSWLFFAPTLDMILGTFEVNYISYWSEDGSAESMGTITIEQNPEKENGLLIKGLFVDDAVMEATYDLTTAQIIIPDWQPLGYYTNSAGNVYGVMFAIYGADEVAFTINADGTITSSNPMWGLYALDENFEQEVGWLDVAVSTEFAPVSAAARKANAKAAKVLKNVKKLSASARSLKKHVRK